MVQNDLFMKKIVAFIFLLVSVSSFAQYGYRDNNRIGISGGVTQLSLFSNQFNASPEAGWIGGFSLRGNYYNNWQAVFGMHFTDSNFSMQSVANEDIKFKLSAVQIYLVASYMVVENHLTLEIGPVLQVNGKLKIDDLDENKFLKDSPLLTANDIVDITKINGNIYAGVTAGFKQVRLHFSYQYGLNNIMNNLNKKAELVALNGNEKFKGNIGLISGMITFYL